MTSSFIKYFFRYLVFSKTRQRLLFLAITGLFLSSFSLQVLQSTMKGLQGNLIGRSKEINGVANLELSGLSNMQVEELFRDLERRKTHPVLEYEIELLVKQGNYIAPAIIHGIDYERSMPPFFMSEPKRLVLGSELAYKLSALEGDQIRLISPSHVNSLFGDVPRMITTTLDRIYPFNVSENDELHGYMPIRSIQNLIGKQSYNRIRLFKKIDFAHLSSILKKHYGDKVVLKTWEDQNRTLMWALNLENTVLVFLFISMTLLVSLSITSGLMIFFSKVKGDLASFWILGASNKKIDIAVKVFLQLLSLSSVIGGLICAFIFLFLFDRYAGEILPDVFVDRKIPVKITAFSVALSFFVPYLISLFFSMFTYRNFKKNLNPLEYIRSLGR